MLIPLTPSSPGYAQVDTFFITAPDVGEMQSLRLTSDGKHMGTAWHLDHVEVHNSKTNESLTFPFGNWFDNEHGLTHLLYPDRDGDGVADKGPVADTKVCNPRSDTLQASPLPPVLPA